MTLRSSSSSWNGLARKLMGARFSEPRARNKGDEPDSMLPHSC